MECSIRGKYTATGVAATACLVPQHIIQQTSSSPKQLIQLNISWRMQLDYYHTDEVISQASHLLLCGTSSGSPRFACV